MVVANTVRSTDGPPVSGGAIRLNLAPACSSQGRPDFLLMRIRVRRAIRVVALIGLCISCCAQNTTNNEPRCVVAGTVVDAISGQPVKGAEISASRLTATDEDVEPIPQYTDVDGQFAIENLPPNRYVLQAYHDGYKSPERRSDPGLMIVALAPGQRIENAIVSLTPGGIITGRISDEAGTPLAGASLQAMKYSCHDGKRELEEMASASTNMRGEYRITGLAPGSYYLRASGPQRLQANAGKNKAYVPIYYLNASQLTRAAELVVSLGEELTGIDLSFAPLSAVHIKGRVIGTGRPWPSKGVKLTLLSDQGNTLFPPGQASSDAEGRFDLPGIPQGSYILVAEVDSNASPDSTLWGRKSLEVSDVNVEDVEIQLGPGVNVNGRIRVEGKSGLLDVSELEATLEPKEGVTLNSLMPSVEGAPVRPDGTFTFRHVPEGTYSIDLSPLPAGVYLGETAGSSVLETGITVDPSRGAPRVELVLSSTAAWIEGTVSEDVPIAGASIVVVPEPRRRNQPRYFRVSVSNPLGKFAFRGMAPGDYKLFAWDEMPSDAFMDPDFLREYEDRGQFVHLDENTQVSVQLQLLRAQ